MVKRIDAYQAEDGSVHSSYIAAIRHDADVKLEKLGWNAGLRKDMLNQAREIVRALDPILKAEPIAADTVEAVNAAAQ